MTNVARALNECQSLGVQVFEFLKKFPRNSRTGDQLYPGFPSPVRNSALSLIDHI